MRYAKARLEKDSRDYAYRIYVTDALRIIGETLANAEGGQYITRRFADMLEPQKEIDVQNVIDDVVKKAGLTIL